MRRARTWTMDWSNRQAKQADEVWRKRVGNSDAQDLKQVRLSQFLEDDEVEVVETWERGQDQIKRSHPWDLTNRSLSDMEFFFFFFV